MATASSRRATPKKRAPQPKEESSGVALKWANEALSVIFYALAVFLLISFISHQIEYGDLTLFGFNRSELFHRPLGPVGQVVGTVLTGFLGWCSLVLVLWAGMVGSYFWRNEDLRIDYGRSPKLLLLMGVLGILVFSCALAAVFWGAAGGGSVGSFVAGPLERYFSIGGASLITGSLFLLSFAVATRQSVAHILESAWAALCAFSAFTFVTLPKFLTSVFRFSFEFLVNSIRKLPVPERVGVGAERLSGSFNSKIENDIPFQLPKARGRRASGLANRVEVVNEDDKSSKVSKGPQVEPSVPVVKEVADIESAEVATEADDDARIVVKRRDAEELARAQALARKRRKSDDEIEVSGNPRFPGYELPDVAILSPGELSVGGENDDELREKSRQIENKLKDFGIYGKVTHVHPGPVITLFEFEPAPGVKVGKIAALQDDLAMSLRASSLRIIAPIPRRGTVGIEVPNKNRDIVRLRDVLESEAFLTAESILSVAIGKDTYGDPFVVDIAAMPHLLMAGATGTGKSVCINTLLVSMLYRASPADLGLILIDPKILELSTYEDIPHLRVPVVTDPRQAKGVLQWAVNEMNRRYRMMQRFGVRNIDGYNALVKGEVESDQLTASAIGDDVIPLSEESVVEAGTVSAAVEEPIEEKPIATEKLEALPKIVIVIDELADLMLTVGRDIEELITRLAQKARAAGIHLIIATQRPSVDVITGLIKANFPARLSFRVTARVDSRTILDQMGADKLLGRGDMLFMQPGAEALRRVHGAFVSDSEVQAVVAAVRGKAKPQYDERILDLCRKAVEEDQNPATKDLLHDEDEYDAIYDKAVELVLQKGQASTSMLQRAFRIGYNRAARIVDLMEKEGLVGPMDGAKPREVIVPTHEPDGSQ